jgi:hypothetical protein
MLAALRESVRFVRGLSAVDLTALPPSNEPLAKQSWGRVK